MRLKITDVNFTTDKEWLFKLEDGNAEYFILSDIFYKSNGFNSLITKNELDSLDIGHSILCETRDFGELKVVTKIK